MNQKQLCGAFSCGLIALCGCGASVVTPIGGGPSGGSSGASSSASTGPGGTTVQGDAGTVGASTGGGGASGTAPVVHIVDPTLAAQIAGTWTGYVENYAFFGDQTSAVTLVLDMNAAGHATFGNSPALPVATDPNVGYPPDIEAGESGAPLIGGPHTGFPFTIQNVSLENSRFQFDVAPAELWTAWCQLQTPIHDELNPQFYSCVHNWATSAGSGGGPGGSDCMQQDPMTLQMVPIDCGKLLLCGTSAVCACTAEGCAVSSIGPVRLTKTSHFDLNIELPRADGSVALDALHNIHLTKN